MKWKIGKSGHRLTNPAAIHLVQSCSGAGFGHFSISPPPSYPAGWLDANSWFRSWTLVTSKKSQIGTPTDAEIADYTANSVMIHYVDAWSYFSAAMHSLSNQRYRQSIHFAYYGSLHASMSILASAGIGVWNQRHTALNDLGTVTYLEDSGTHVFSWEALSNWIESSQNTDSIMKNLQYEWISIYDLVAELGGGSSQGLFGRWFSTWTSDLETWVNDHNLRNEASYRPSLMMADETLPDSVVRSFFHDIWSLLRPVGTNKFGQLDSVLLYLTLIDIKGNLGIDMNDMSSRIGQASASLGLTTSDAGILSAGLGAEVLSPNPIFVHAIDTTRSVDDPYSALSVISRTLFLIRVASAASSSRFSGARLDNWAKAKSEQFGFIDDANDLGTLDDLWQDISIELENLSSLDRSGSRAEQLFRLQILTEFERAALWTLSS